MTALVGFVIGVPCGIVLAVFAYLLLQKSPEERE